MAAAAVAGRLAEAASDAAHAFWPDDVSLLDPGILRWDSVLGHRQVTDHYLLALAVRHRGRFLTFDARVRTAGVARAKPARVWSSRASGVAPRLRGRQRP